VFCGQVLPLEKDIVMNGSPREKHEHLMSVLTEFLEERVADLVRQTTPDADAEGESESWESSEEEVADGEADEGPDKETISQPEIDQFVKVDLNLLDNKDYFRAVFG